MDEQKKYEVIKKLVDTNGNKDRAAMTLGISRRQVNRLIIAYNDEGKGAFVHGNRGRKPAITTLDEVRRTVVDLYRTKYYGANFVHFTELLKRNENISLSVSAVTNYLETENIYSPRVTKAKRKGSEKNSSRKRLTQGQRKKLMQFRQILWPLRTPIPGARDVHISANYCRWTHSIRMVRDEKNNPTYRRRRCHRKYSRSLFRQAGNLERILQRICPDSAQIWDSLQVLY